MISDDHSYGSCLIRTPNIDQIARQGTLMEEARVTNSICSPSCAVIFTGKYLPGHGHYYKPEFMKMGKDTFYNGYVTDVINDLALDWITKNKNNGPFSMILQHKAPT
jgi:arylsulfatase A-like enzyme